MVKAKPSALRIIGELNRMPKVVPRIAPDSTAAAKSGRLGGNAFNNGNIPG